MLCFIILHTELCAIWCMPRIFWHLLCFSISCYSCESDSHSILANECSCRLSAAASWFMVWFGLRHTPVSRGLSDRVHSHKSHWYAATEMYYPWTWPWNMALALISVDWFNSTLKLCCLKTIAVKQLHATVHAWSGLWKTISSVVL